MIQKIKINNFQSHKKTEVDFSSGVNIIVGTSDSGKTAILRALQWAVHNEPGGDAFRSHWGGDTTVEATIDDCVVVREKGKKGNIYKLDDEEFTAFGQGVPAEIAKHINMTNVNLQKQLDSPFLITETPGQVASYFNEIANLEQIDTTLQHINKKQREVKSSVEMTETEITKKSKILSEFIDIDAAITDIEVLEALAEKQKTIKEKKIKLNNTISKLERIQRKQRRLKVIIAPEKDINSILLFMESFAKKFRYKKELGTKATLLAKNKKKQNNLSFICKAEKDITSLLSLHDKKLEKKKDLVRLDTSIRKLKYISKKIKPLLHIINAKELIDILLQTYTKFNDKKEEVLCLRNTISKANKKSGMVVLKANEIETLQKDYKENYPNECPFCETIINN